MGIDISARSSLCNPTNILPGNRRAVSAAESIEKRYCVVMTTFTQNIRQTSLFPNGVGRCHDAIVSRPLVPYNKDVSEAHVTYPGDLNTEQAELSPRGPMAPRLSQRFIFGAVL